MLVKSEGDMKNANYKTLNPNPTKRVQARYEEDVSSNF